MIQNQFPVRGVPGSAVSVLLPPAELWVPPRTQLSPEVPRGGPALFSSCRRGICRPCRSRSQRSCRRHQTGRERPAVSRGEEEPRSHQQGPPAPPGSGPALGELLSTQADTEAPAPLFGSQERRSPSQGKSQAPDSTQVDQGLGPSLCPKPQEAPCPLRPSKPGSSKPFT